MAPPIMTMKSLPPVAQSTAAKIATLGFGERRWRYEGNHDLAEASKVSQVRDIEDRAPAKKVAHYAEMLRPFTGARLRGQMTFPPVIYTNDGYLLDGNTRDQAARRLGWVTFPAIVLNDNWEGANEALMEKFLSLGTLLNITNGTDLSRANVERLLAQIVKDDDSPADIAKKLQVSRSTVMNLMNATKTRKRADELGVDLSGAKITRTHLSDLGAAIDKFTNPVFVNFLELIRDAELSTNEQRSIAKRIFAAGEEFQKMEIISEERASRHGKVTGHAGRPPQSAQLRQALGKILKFKDNPGRAVEDAPESSQLHRTVIWEAISTLQKIANEQDIQDSKRLLAEAEMARRN
jgi:hypothetical protein